MKNCFLCQRFESKPYRHPPSQRKSTTISLKTISSLWNHRCRFSRSSFSQINSNYFYKSQIVLFTCAVTRAVHLEVVPNLAAPSFICALKRFISRRGIPNLIISDNGTCFKNEQVRFSEELTRMNISWKFNIAASPWWGGFWERLVQSVKRSLRTIYFDQP